MPRLRFPNLAEADFGFVSFRVPRRRRFVSGEAAKPSGGGGEATTGETKSQAQAWLPRRNRRQAIRRFRPFSWSRASAKLSNLPCRRRSWSRVCAMPQKPESANSLSFRVQTGTALCPKGVASVTKRSGVCGQKERGLWPQKRIGVISTVFWRHFYRVCASIL